MKYVDDDMVLASKTKRLSMTDKPNKKKPNRWKRRNNVGLRLLLLVLLFFGIKFYGEIQISNLRSKISEKIVKSIIILILMPRMPR